MSTAREVDVFGGLLGRMKRSLVASRLRGTMQESLLAARDIVERGPRATR
jgi:hypothetical protein